MRTALEGVPRMNRAREYRQAQKDGQGHKGRGQRLVLHPPPTPKQTQAWVFSGISPVKDNVLPKAPFTLMQSPLSDPASDMHRILLACAKFLRASRSFLEELLSSMPAEFQSRATEHDIPRRCTPQHEFTCNTFFKKSVRRRTCFLVYFSVFGTAGLKTDLSGDLESSPSSRRKPRRVFYTFLHVFTCL